MIISDSQRIARNTIYMFFRMVLVLVITLYTSRVILHTLGVEDFGIYNVVGSVVVFLSFLQTALTSATYRYIAFELGAKNYAGLNKTYSMAINTHLILAILLVIFVELIGSYFIEYKLNIPEDRIRQAFVAFHFSVLTFAISIIRTPFNSNIIAHEKMKFFAIISIIEVVLKLFVAYSIVVSPIDKLVTYSALLALVAILLFIVYVIYCKFKIDETQYINCWDSKLLYKFISYSGWSMLVNGADVCGQQSISIFFNIYIGVIANAALGIAQQINVGINSFVGSFTQAFNPQIIKSYASGNLDYFSKLLFSTSKISFLLILIISVPIVVNVEYVLSIWLGDYPELAPSFIRVMIIYWIFDAFQYPLWQAVYATGKIKYHQIMISTIKVLVIPLSYIILKFDGSGVNALLSWSLLNGVCAFARTLYMKKLINMDVKRYFKDVICRNMLLCLFVIPLTFLISNRFGQNFISLILSSIFSTLSLILIGIFIVLNNKERIIFFKLPIIKKIFKIK